MTDSPSPPVARRLLVVILLVQVMVALDMSVVNVALPHIRSSLGFSASNLTWVIDAYSLTFGGLMMLGGRIGDVAGRRRTLLAGLVVFGLASLAGGLAQTTGELIAARAVQGVGAAMLTPIAFTLITVHFPPGRARSRALGLWGASAAVGGALGVLAGGLLTQSAGWRTVLFINLPIVAFALVEAAMHVPADRHQGQRPPLDIAGALLATAGLSAVVYGVVRTDTHPWGSATTLGTLAVAAALLVAFAAVEQRAHTPLLRLRLLTRRPVVAANLFVLLLFSGQFAAFYFVSLYCQQVLGYGPATTGAAFVPFSVGIIIGAAVATHTVAQLGPRWLLVIGGTIAAVGFGWFGLAMNVSGSFLASILGPSMIASIGLGLCFVPVGTAATVGVDPAEAGMASGLLTSSRQIGGSIGLAALATVAVTVTSHHHGTPLAGLADGYATATGLCGALLLIAALLALVLLRTRPPADAVDAAEGDPHTGRRPASSTSPGP